LLFPEHTEKLTVPAQKGFRLDKEERLFPRPNYSSQNHQKQPVPLPIDGSFDLPTQDDQLLP